MQPGQKTTLARYAWHGVPLGEVPPNGRRLGRIRVRGPRAALSVHGSAVPRAFLGALIGGGVFGVAGDKLGEKAFRWLTM